MKEIKVNIKSASGRKNRIAERTMLFDESIATVRELIISAVHTCVDEYNLRCESSKLLEVLSPEMIEDRAQLGKVSFGVNYGGKQAEYQRAAAQALEAFEDGIVVIFAGDKQLTSLDEAVSLNQVESLTFIKLTMLAGRMW